MNHSVLTYKAVDSHTEGMPTRVITDGVGVLPGETMLERKLRFERDLDGIRLLLMREPRGHERDVRRDPAATLRPGADWGVVFIEVSGCLPMCGHGTIGVATVLVEERLVEVTEPETVIALDVPAGLVTARVAVTDGRAERSRSRTSRPTSSSSTARSAAFATTWPSAATSTRSPTPRRSGSRSFPSRPPI